MWCKWEEERAECVPGIDSHWGCKLELQSEVGYCLASIVLDKLENVTLKSAFLAFFKKARCSKIQVLFFSTAVALMAGLGRQGSRVRLWRLCPAKGTWQMGQMEAESRPGRVPYKGPVGRMWAF